MFPLCMVEISFSPFPLFQIYDNNGFFHVFPSLLFPLDKEEATT